EQRILNPCVLGSNPRGPISASLSLSNASPATISHERQGGVLMTNLTRRSKRPKLPGTLMASRDALLIAGYHRLPPYAQQAVISALAGSVYTSASHIDSSDLLVLLEPSKR